MNVEVIFSFTQFLKKIEKNSADDNKNMYSI